MTVSVLVVACGLIAIWWYALRTDLADTPVTVQQSAATDHQMPLPKQCADALALADILASHVGPLAQAANDHVNIMQLLQLTIDGKPGGIDGKEAFRRSMPQMMTMEAHGPDASVQVKRYKQIRKKCPLG
jgi:hypothetical protein